MSTIRERLTRQIETYVSSIIDKRKYLWSIEANFNDLFELSTREEHETIKNYSEIFKLLIPRRDILDLTKSIVNTDTIGLIVDEITDSLLIKNEIEPYIKLGKKIYLFGNDEEKILEFQTLLGDLVVKNISDGIDEREKYIQMFTNIIILSQCGKIILSRSDLLVEIAWWFAEVKPEIVILQTPQTCPPLDWLAGKTFNFSLDLARLIHEEDISSDSQFQAYITGQIPIGEHVICQDELSGYIREKQYEKWGYWIREDHSLIRKTEICDSIVALNPKRILFLGDEEILLAILLTTDCKISVRIEESVVNFLNHRFNDRLDRVFKGDYDVICVDTDILEWRLYSSFETLWLIPFAFENPAFKTQMRNGITKAKLDFSKVPTLVTAFYDIRGIEGAVRSQDNKLKDLETYIKLGSYVMSLPYPIVLYTHKEIADRFEALRPEGLKSLFKMIIIPFEETYFYKDLDRIAQLREEYPIYNLNMVKDTPLYIILNNNKHFFIEKTIEYNPFKTSHFMWIDLGIAHLGTGNSSIKRWITNIPDKIRQLLINPYLEDTPPHEYFKNVHHNVAGGLFSGSGEYLLKYGTLFKETWERVLSEGWYQLDEAIMGIISREHPEIYSHYYGDYDSLLDNYDGCQQVSKYTENIIFLIAHKYLNCRKYTNAYELLLHIKNHYLKIKNEDFLSTYLIANYYVSPSHSLDEDVLKVIETLPNFVKSYQNNLSFYSNTRHLLISS